MGIALRSLATHLRIGFALGLFLLAASATAGDPPARLQTDGPWFVDDDGRVVILHGVNLVDKGGAANAYPNELADGDGFTEADAVFLKSQGLNALRLGIGWEHLLPDRPPVPGSLSIDTDYLDKVLRVSRIAAAHEIWTLLDFHQDCFGQWPEWAIPWNPIDPTSAPFPACYLIPNGAGLASDNLWKNPDPDPVGPPDSLVPVAEVWTNYKEVWRQVTEHFVDEPYLLGYDFMNEPSAGSSADSCLNPSLGCQPAEEHIQVFQQNALDGIRQADPAGPGAGIAFFQPALLTGGSGAASGLGNDPSPANPDALGPVSDPKVAYTFHVYCGGSELAGDRDLGCDVQANAFTGTGGMGGAARNAAHMVGADDATRSYPPNALLGPRNPDAVGWPALVSEFGSTKAATIIQGVVELADAHMMSWTYWEYQDGNGGQDSIFENSTDEQNLDFATGGSPRADHVIRTYPRATAGTPVGWSFDPATKAFSFDFDTVTALANQSSEIFVPVEHHYDGRYCVSLTGPAEVTSAANAPLLMLANTGTGSVHVEVNLPDPQDLDCDGVPNDQDNCPLLANAGQEDRGGLDSTAADGIGDACQCGDVTGNGIVNGQDAGPIKRYGLSITPNPSFVEPGNCDVSGNDRCNGQDANAIRRAALGLASPNFGQNCHNALGVPIPEGL